ncbi:hypothetical protein ACFL3T_03925 [Patescibacteria group bacterium]
MAQPSEGPQKPERTPQEIRKMKLRMAKIARMFSGTHRLNVVPGEGWAMGFQNHDEFSKKMKAYLKGEITEEEFDALDPSLFKPTSLTYDQSWFEEKTEGEIDGVTRHEVGHANNSDYRLLAKGQRLALDDGYLPSSFASAWNAREDPWVNNCEMYPSDTVRDQMRALYEKATPMVLDEMRSGKSSLNRQLGIREMLEWMKDEFGCVDQATLDDLDKNYLDPRVVETLQETMPISKRFFNPNNTALENYLIMRDELWPHIKKLEVQNFKDKIIDELTKPKPKGGQPGSEGGQPGGEGGQPGGGGGGEAQPTLGGQGGGGQMNPMIDKLPPDLKKRLMKELEKQASQSPEGIQGQTQGKAGEAGTPEGQEPQQGQGQPGQGEFDPSQIPEDLKKDIIDAVEGLSPEDKEALKEAAKAELDKQQAEENDKNPPKSMETVKDEDTGTYMQVPKADDADDAKDKKRELEKFEFEDRKEQEAKKDAIKEQLKEAKTQEEVDQIMENADIPEEHREELEQQAETQKQSIETKAQQKKVAMQKEGFEEREESLYDELKMLETAAKTGLQSFVKFVARFLPKKTDLEWAGPHKTGKRIMKKELPKKIPTKRYDVYSKRHEKLSEDPKMFVKLIIDRSGSMKGKPMEESMKTAMFFANVLTEFGIPFSITFFDSGTERVMKFGQELNEKGSRVKVEMMRASKKSGGTNIEKVLKEADEELKAGKKRYPECLSSIFFIGDGGANEGMTGQALTDYIDALKKKHIITAYALGSGGKALINLFGEDNTVEVDEFEDLHPEAKSTLKQVLRRVAKHFKL